MALQKNKLKKKKGCKKKIKVDKTKERKKMKKDFFFFLNNLILIFYYYDDNFYFVIIIIMIILQMRIWMFHEVFYHISRKEEEQELRLRQLDLKVILTNLNEYD